jgi:hypothetical protein
LNGVWDEGQQGYPIGVALATRAQQADYILLSFSESTCSIGAFADCGGYNAAFKNALWSFLNNNQTLFTVDQWFATLDTVKTSFVDGQNPSAWLTGRASTFSTGVNGSYFGVVATPRVNPEYLELLATNQSQGIKTMINTGTAKVDFIDTTGKVAFSQTYNLAGGNEIGIASTVRVLAYSAYTVQATYLDAGGKTLATVTNAFAAVDPSVAWTPTSLLPTIFLLGSVRSSTGTVSAASSTFTVTNGTVDYTAPGVVRVSANCAGNPCAITANTLTLSVTVPLTRAVAVPAQ